MNDLRKPPRIAPRRLLLLALGNSIADTNVASTMRGMTLLPNNARAILDIRKIESYCLNPEHPRGRHKARPFRAALGIGPADAAWLRTVLLEAARVCEAIEVVADDFGSRWHVDVPVSRHGYSAMVRTVWIVRTGEDVPRFVTCWVL